mmetsp:Transcript_57841/g.125775  ORF Transcript_57841/g.125775 Transcript_57841/m.125775 type:complete len:87 (+) Transcript_57841:261-521(+)
MKRTLQEKNKELDRIRNSASTDKLNSSMKLDTESKVAERRLKTLEKENRDLSKKMKTKVKSTANFMESFQKQTNPRRTGGSTRKGT